MRLPLLSIRRPETNLDLARPPAASTGRTGAIPWLAVLLLAATPLLAQAQDTLLYVGTFSERGSEGIYVFAWEGADPALQPLQTQGGLESPSFLALHPAGHTLYAVNRAGVEPEPDLSSVSAFAIDAAGRLQPRGSASTFGQGGCHVAVDASGQSLFAGNYSSGNLAHYRLQADGGIGPLLDTIRHAGSGPVEGRQEGPHVHQTLLSPDNAFLYVADLGTDRVEVYTLQPGRELRPRHSTAVAPGTGPRHMAFHPNGRYAYLAGELNSSIVAFEKGADGKLEVLEQASTLPEDFTGSSYNADIHVHPSGRYVYVSNRGHNSIAWFRIDAASGRLEAAGHVPTEGDWPRNFTISPDGHFLLVANRRSDAISIFRIEMASGRPVFTGKTVSVPAPVCLIWRVAN